MLTGRGSGSPGQAVPASKQGHTSEASIATASAGVWRPGLSWVRSQAGLDVPTLDNGVWD